LRDAIHEHCQGGALLSHRDMMPLVIPIHIARDRHITPWCTLPSLAQQLLGQPCAVELDIKVIVCVTSIVDRENPVASKRQRLVVSTPGRYSQVEERQ
jgi:hypothetical protein